jgi:RNA polymerase sigma-70 factor (ECF subfamily)
MNRVAPSSALRPSALKELLSIRSELLGYLEARTGSKDAAEDVLHSAYVRCIEKGATLRRDESVVPWFYTLLSRALVDLSRRRAAQARALEAFARELERCVVAAPDAQHQVCLCIRRLVDLLKPEYQRALRLVDVDGEPLGELARREGISTNNASVRLHRARRALARRVRAVCGQCAPRKCLDCTCAVAG